MSAARGGRNPVSPLQPAAAGRRVVLLGASNLTRSFSRVVWLLRQMWESPIEIMAALGHGRSYGAASRVMFRELPGIRQCGIWAALAASPAKETYALVTDIGNDILYGAACCQIAEWVEECVDRLQRLSAHTTLTLLPVDNLLALERLRYYFFRTMSYPGCRLTLADACTRAGELNGSVRAIAAARGAAVVQQRTDWYGLDPVHIRGRDRQRAWREILSKWPGGSAPAQRQEASGRPLPLQGLRPESRRLFDRVQLRRQPCKVLADGTSISIY